VEPSSSKENDDSNEKAEKTDNPKKSSVFERWKNSDAGRNSPKPSYSDETTKEESKIKLKNHS
jgi:hypothetical protein